MVPEKFLISYTRGFWMIIFYLAFARSILMLILELLIPDKLAHDLDPALTMVIGTFSIFLLTWLLRLNIRHRYDQGFSFGIPGNIDFRLLMSLLVFTTGYVFTFRSSLGWITDNFTESGLFTEIEKRLTEEYERNKWQALYPHIVLSPIYEEVVVRGAVLRGLLNRYKTTHAILLSGILFGITHFYLSQVINAITFGIALSFMYYFSRSLMLCILVHIYHNGLAVTLFYTGFSFGWNSFLTGLILLLLSGWILTSRLKKQMEKEPGTKNPPDGKIPNYETGTLKRTRN